MSFARKRIVEQIEGKVPGFGDGENYSEDSIFVKVKVEVFAHGACADSPDPYIVMGDLCMPIREVLREQKEEQKDEPEQEEGLSDVEIGSLEDLLKSLLTPPVR